LGGLIDQVLWRFGDDPWAEKTYRSLVKVFAASKDKLFASFTASLQGQVRRFELPGKPITVEGKLLHGEKFDWSMYAGKVVVVYFWATHPDACFRDLPSLEECYDLYHAKGFEIVGLSCDQKRAELEAFVKERKIPWAILFDDKPSPTVEYYSIRLIPRLILVGRNGKVVSLNVRGDQLREELGKLFGPPKETKESPAVKEAGEGAKEPAEKAKK
jgi:peroxiredoxin